MTTAIIFLQLAIVVALIFKGARVGGKYKYAYHTINTESDATYSGTFKD